MRVGGFEVKEPIPTPVPEFVEFLSLAAAAIARKSVAEGEAPCSASPDGNSRVFSLLKEERCDTGGPK